MRQLVRAVARVIGAVIALAPLLVVDPPHAVAQSLLQQWFGLGSSSAPGARLSPHSRPGSAFRLPRSAYPFMSWQPRYGDEDSDPLGAPDDGVYRTVCVRLCDGYYWPITFAAGRDRFYQDARACAAGCGAEARLFYHATTAEMASAVDLTGRAYARLPTAFLYRKALIPGCACRPDPWSPAERERHRSYARAEAAATGLSRSGADNGPVRSNEPSVPADDISDEQAAPWDVIPAAGSALPRPRRIRQVPAGTAWTSRRHLR